MLSDSLDMKIAIIDTGIEESRSTTNQLFK